MKRVILESPYSAPTEDGIETHRRYARRALHDCLARGEAPIAPHLLFTQPGVLDDTDPEERTLGIAAGHAWFPVAEACVVYTDYGISRGMEEGMKAAELHGVPVEKRTIGVAPSASLSPPQNTLFAIGDYWRNYRGDILQIVKIAPGDYPWITARYICNAKSENYSFATIGLNPEGKWSCFKDSDTDLKERITDPTELARLSKP